VKKYSFTSGYGYRWGSFHDGVDLAAPRGTPVYAVKSGTVTTARYYGGYGYAVIIKHANGVETLYGHNSRLLVRKGQKVYTGQKIALVGSSGYSTGPHLHFRVHVYGSSVNPVTFLAKRGVYLR
jgi:murein DD-endopeptidase MepM/ murein hydrolase activator NlpD